MKTIEPNLQNIQVGDRVMVTFAWREDELPTKANFHFGLVLAVTYKEMSNVSLLKFQVEGLDRLVPVDRVKLVEKGGLADSPFAQLNYQKCFDAYRIATLKGYRGRVVSRNFNHTEFEIESDRNTYQQTIHYSDVTDEIFGSCNCLHFLNKKAVCKHLAQVGLEELFQVSAPMMEVA